MNEFEWRRQMRELRQPLTPQRDLWASLAAALDDAERTDAPTIQASPMHRSGHRQRWLVVASLAASVLLAAGIGWHRLQMPTSTPIARVSTAPASWKPADPRLAGAAIELDAARMELQLAIQQAPHSPALQRLLDRTELQQTQLRQLANQAG
ncbi:hypothetical protein GCM10008098_01820 [Rhodanobacter panaciterrae]|uniref:Anti-sigma factor n=1 Tax=Rhodanobacter panaciterrae TaxID=490572 RepID=A0ABQ2ZGL4_9GAMM|nr:hypothetical protein [Rhodanobacter panaciterrae]GGY14636.1 hypothetical protein GCM10008098_01820 [Rhodanobacter panaciterrae]